MTIPTNNNKIFSISGFASQIYKNKITKVSFYSIDHNNITCENVTKVLNLFRNKHKGVAVTSCLNDAEFKSESANKYKYIIKNKSKEEKSIYFASEEHQLYSKNDEKDSSLPITDSESEEQNENNKILPQDNKLVIHSDDSTDEEIVKDIVESYNLEKSQAEFKESETFKNIKHDNFILEKEIIYSFILHSHAISMLNSEEINEKFYKLKQRYLKNNDENYLNAIKSSLKEITAETIKCLNGTINPTLTNSSDIRRKFELLDGDKTILANTLSKDNRILYADNITNLRKSSQIELNQFIDKLIDNFIKSTNNLQDIEYDRGNLRRQNTHIEVQRLLFLVYRDIFIEKDFLDNWSSKLDLESINLEESSTLKSNIKEQITVLKGNRHLSENTIKSKAYDPIVDILSNLVEIYKQEDKISNLLGLLLISDVPPGIEEINKIDYLLEIKKVLPLNNAFVFKKYIRELFLAKFFVVLQEKMKNISEEYRPFLDEWHTFEAKNSIEFLANLRLSNRSQIRKIRNYINVPLQKDLALSTRNAGFSTIQTKDTWHSRWEFGKSNRIQYQQKLILSDEPGRLDWVDNNGSYQNIYLNLEIYKNRSSGIITDSQIAIWVREILKCENLPLNEGKLMQSTKLSAGDLNSLKRELAGLTFLLFGCEVMRNPASLILHNMMLDLIIDEKLTWKDVLNTEYKVMLYKGISKLEEITAELKNIDDIVFCVFTNKKPEFYHWYNGKATLLEYNEAKTSSDPKSFNKIKDEFIKEVTNQDALKIGKFKIFIKPFINAIATKEKSELKPKEITMSFTVPFSNVLKSENNLNLKFDDILQQYIDLKFDDILQQYIKDKTTQLDLKSKFKGIMQEFIKAIESEDEENLIIQKSKIKYLFKNYPMLMMPMSPKGAISISRNLNETYNDFVPLSYNYQGSERSKSYDSNYDIKMMIKQESALLTLWLKEFVTQECNQNYCDIINLINKRQDLWFNTHGVKHQ